MNNEIEKLKQSYKFIFAFGPIIGLFLYLLCASGELHSLGIWMGLGFTILCFAIGLYERAKVKKQEENIKREQERLKEQAERDKPRLLYIACKLNQIYNIDTSKNLKKARLIGKQKNYLTGRETDSQIKEIFDTGQKMAEEAAKKEEMDTRRELLEKERKEYENSIKYLRFHGRSKPIQYYRELQKQYEDAAKSQEELSLAIRSSAVQQKEIDWATHGGIASAIAGPAAGIATALDIQEKNRSIREANASNKAAVNNLSVQVLSNSIDARSKAWKYEKEANSYETKLVEDKTNYFDKIEVINKCFTKTKSGSIKVAVSVRAKEDIFIYGKVPAVIDGSFILKLSCDGNPLGSVFLLLPVDGLIGTVNLESVWVNEYGKDTSGDITGELENYDTWAIEPSKLYMHLENSISIANAAKNSNVKKSNTKDTPIEEIEDINQAFNRSQLKQLKAKGINTLGDLCKTGDKELLQIAGIGKATVRNWNSLRLKKHY